MKTILVALITILLTGCGTGNGVSLKPLNSEWTSIYNSLYPDSVGQTVDLRHIEIDKSNRTYGTYGCYYDITFTGTLYGGTYEELGHCVAPAGLDPYHPDTLERGTFQVNSNNILIITRTYDNGPLSPPHIIRAE